MLSATDLELVDLTDDHVESVPDRVDVTVILPVHNEEECLEDEIARITADLDASSYTWEMIAIDDASTDGSAAILDRHPSIRRITLTNNMGTGTARRLGSEAAHGDVVVWTDADMTYPNDEISLLVDALGDADQVIGARRTEEGTHKGLRVPAKWFIRNLAQWLTGARIPDLNSGFRAFRRSAMQPYLPLLPTGFSCVSTITVAMLSDARAVHFREIDYAKRVGTSKFHPIRDTYRYLLQVIRMITFFNPLRVFFPMAVAILAVGAAKAVFDIIDDPVRISTNTLLIFLTGMQILVFGLLADLVVARTKSTKARL